MLNFWRFLLLVLRGFCCLFNPDTKNTQWEDPRLQSPAITGPVSSFLRQKPQDLPFTSWFYLWHAFISLGVFVQQRQITLSLPLNIPTPLCYSVYHFRCCFPSWVTLLLRLHFAAFDKKLLLFQCVHQRFLIISWLLLFVCAGCSLLQRVQAEIRLLQEEIEETSKKWFIKYSSVVGFWVLACGNKAKFGQNVVASRCTRRQANLPLFWLCLIAYVFIIPYTVLTLREFDIFIAC